MKQPLVFDTVTKNDEIRVNITVTLHIVKSEYAYRVITYSLVSAVFRSIRSRVLTGKLQKGKSFLDVPAKRLQKSCSQWSYLETTYPSAT